MAFIYYFLFADSNYQSAITPYRKLLVTLSDKLNESRSLDRMAGFLKDAGHDILQDCSPDDVLGIFQAMEHAKLVSSDNLSLLKEMLNSILRKDLVEMIESGEDRGITKGLNLMLFNF